MVVLNVRSWVIVCALAGCSIENPGSTEGETSEGASETDSGSAPTSTTGDPSLLESCVFDPPCVYVSGADIAEPQMTYDAAMCAWTRLRDAAPSRVDLEVGDEATTLIPLGDAARAVLVVTVVGDDEKVQRCTLTEAAFFQKCIDDGPEQIGEGCAFGFGWYEGCADEPAPVCPEA